MKVKDSVRARGGDEKIVDEIAEADMLWRKAVFKRDRLQGEINQSGKLIGQKKRAKKDASDLIQEVLLLRIIFDPGIYTYIYRSPGRKSK